MTARHQVRLTSKANNFSCLSNRQPLTFLGQQGCHNSRRGNPCFRLRLKNRDKLNRSRGSRNGLALWVLAKWSRREGAGARFLERRAADVMGGDFRASKWLSSELGKCPQVHMGLIFTGLLQCNAVIRMGM